MKTDFLKALGIEQSVIDKIMAENGKDIERYKKQVEDLTGERDTLKGQIEEFSRKLSAFDGVDIDALHKQIDTLKGDMSAKEAEFKAQMADRDFQSTVSTEISAAKGKSAKAIMALLNIDTLKASKNQKEDVAAALKALRESDAYLFDEDKQAEGTPAKVSSGGVHNEPNSTEPDPFTAAAMKGAGLESRKD